MAVPAHDTRDYKFAKKYKIDDNWMYTTDGLYVPRGRFVTGLDRKVLLRRRLYFDTLQKISTDTKVPINRFRVMGDIFDLDLALPQFLGAEVGLATREGTHSYERRASDVVIDNLDEARDFFGI